jgi:hypothetical protein
MHGYAATRDAAMAAFAKSWRCPRRSPSWSRDHAASGERDCRRDR